MIYCYSQRVEQLKEENTHESIIYYVETYIENLKELFMEKKILIGIKSFAFQNLKLLKQLSVTPADANVPFMWTFHRHKKAWAKSSFPLSAFAKDPQNPFKKI